MAWWRRKVDDAADDTADDTGHPSMVDVGAEYERIAREHLEPDVAERWLGLVRPAIALWTEEDYGPRVGRLGGVPLVPAGFAWPTWDGHGALQSVAEIDLAAVAATGLDPGIALLSTGRLLAFYYDGPGRGDPEGTVGGWDPATAPGARLIHLHDDGQALEPATVPSGVEVVAEQPLHARQTTTWPTSEHPAFREALDTDLHDVLLELLEDVDGYKTTEQLGGWAHSIQGPVDHELGARAPATPPLALVLQVGSAGGMQWGDWGTLYWLAPVDELPSLDGVSFDWQT